MRSLRNILRLFAIAGTLLRCNSMFLILDLKLCPKFLKWLVYPLSIFPSKKSKGERIRESLQSLGPFFVKFGQTIATRGDLIGQEISEELSKLQDKMEPVLTKEDAEEIIQSEFGKDIKAAFSKFSNAPIAAASVAEVFKAETKDGKEVAVKFLKPGIKEEFRKDIDLFLWISKIIDKRFKKLKRLRLTEVVNSFEQGMEKEMDLTLEASAASELKDNHSQDSGIYVPEIFWSTTSRSVLTMEWVDGIAVNKISELKKAKINIKKVIKNLTYLFLNEAYRDGFFHADLHPGNVLIRSDSSIALIDFGIMGRLDKKTKLCLAEILKGFLTRDYALVARVHFKAGYVDRSRSEEEFAQACRSIGEPIVGMPSGKISIGKLLSNLFKVTRDFNMPVQPQLLLVQKTTVVLEGLISNLDAKANMWEVAEPWVKEWSQKNTGFDAIIVDSLEEILHFIKNDLVTFIKKHNEKDQCEIKEDSYKNLFKITLFAALVSGAVLLIQHIL